SRTKQPHACSRTIRTSASSPVTRWRSWNAWRCLKCDRWRKWTRGDCGERQDEVSATTTALADWIARARADLPGVLQTGLKASETGELLVTRNMARVVRLGMANSKGLEQLPS